MKIAYLGAGAWGFALANLLASKGHDVTSWTIFPELAKALNDNHPHPKLPDTKKAKNLLFTTDLKSCLENADLIVESVTSTGIRPVFESLSKITTPQCPIVITSKGIEQNSGLILSDIVREVLGEQIKEQMGAISGPSFAIEVVHGLPTSVTGSAYNEKVMHKICDLFTTNTFRVYPNSDMRGVAYGGALKNIIAVACGIAEGLKLGYSARAALMTRGLHEMQKLAIKRGCNPKTLYGLSGMGDLCVTCTAMTSRNFHFGFLLALGKTQEEAQSEIGMVIEGPYTCISALQLSRKYDVPMPITETVYKILKEGLSPKDAVKELMERTIKEEHL